MAERKYSKGNVTLLHSGEEYFTALEKIIRKAKEVIYLQVYILDEDETGKRILAALKDAADRKVRVFLAVDGFGSYSLGAEFKNRMRKDGIFFRYFSPIPFSIMTQAGRRLHVKVCTVDGHYSIVGGINISNRYRGVDDKPWLDYAILAEGPVSEEVEAACMQLWKRRFIRIRKREQPLHSHGNYTVRVRVSLNDWFRSRNQIASGYMRMLRKAREEIIIIASYFIPGKKMLNALLSAVRNGKQVTVILSQQSDVPLVKDAIAYLYPKLLREGVIIYEFETTILHAKACVIDERWLSLGSHNLNNLSELMSVEMNLEVLDHNFAGNFAADMKKLMREECRKVDATEFKQQLSIPVKFRYWLSYNTLALIQRLLYLFFRRETFPRRRKTN